MARTVRPKPHDPQYSMVIFLEVIVKLKFVIYKRVLINFTQYNWCVKEEEDLTNSGEEMSSRSFSNKNQIDVYWANGGDFSQIISD